MVLLSSIDAIIVVLFGDFRSQSKINMDQLKALRIIKPLMAKNNAWAFESNNLQEAK